MKVIIDTEKKTIEVPSDLKKAYDLLGNNCSSILSLINMSDFDIKTKKISSGDRLKKEDIDLFMDEVKEQDKEKYDEYNKLKNKKVGTTKDGEPIYTNFLVLKKWFYDNFPSEKPEKKDKKKK